MPVPRTKDVGKLRRFFKEHHPEWSEKQNLAASLNQAREAGASIREKPSRRRMARRRS